MLARTFWCSDSISQPCPARSGNAESLARQDFLHILYHKSPQRSTRHPEIWRLAIQCYILFSFKILLSEKQYGIIKNSKLFLGKTSFDYSAEQRVALPVFFRCKIHGKTKDNKLFFEKILFVSSEKMHCADIVFR